MAKKQKRPPLKERVEIQPGIHRVAAAMQALTKGGYTETRELLMETYGISDTQAENDIAAAYKIIQADAVREAPFVRARLVAQATRIVNEAENRGDYQAALRGLAVIGKWHGLEAPTQVSVTMQPQYPNLEKISVDRRRELLGIVRELRTESEADSSDEAAGN